MALLAAGCASQPSHPPVNAAAAPAVPAANAAVPAASAAAPTENATPGDIQAQRLAKAKNLNLKIYNKDGKELFCRSNYVTASRIERDMRCYTAEQLDQMDRQVQRQFEQFLQAPNFQNPAMLPTK
jgi:hypothetical protein